MKGIGLGKTLAGVFGNAGLKLPPQGAVVHLLTDQHQLVFALAIPLAVIDRKAFASQVKNMALFAFVEPQDAFGTKNALGQLVVEEVLKFAQGEGSVATK